MPEQYQKVTDQAIHIFWWIDRDYWMVD